MNTARFNQPKPKIYMRIAFATVAAGVATAVYFLISAPGHEPARLLTPEEQNKLKSDPARNPPPKNWEDTFLKEKVPGEERARESGNVTNPWVEAAKPHEMNAEDLEDKREALDVAKEYYERFLTESDPIERYNRLATVKSYVERYPDVLKMLGMSKERFEGLVKSVGAQAGPSILDKMKTIEKYDRDKIGYVINLRKIGELLTDNNRFRYYESLGTNREEMQGHLCDGVVATARTFLSHALSVKADKITENIYKSHYIPYLETLAEEMSFGYRMVCENVGRDVYKEVNITDAQIKALLEFKPEIIPEPAPNPAP